MGGTFLSGKASSQRTKSSQQMDYDNDNQNFAGGIMSNVVAFATARHEQEIEASPLSDVPPFSEEALALEFAAAHQHDLRYVPTWGWLHYDRKWKLDDQLTAFDFSRRICRQAARECDKGPQAAAIASAKTVAAVERLARSDRLLIANVEQWDSDQFMLSTPNGVVDLKTGRIRQARPLDYVTKMTAVSPIDGCPSWTEFLKRITDGDDELQSYLQRMVGYMLTGDTREHALFFAYGTGANGKSTLINAVSGMIADYHKTAPIETFTESKSDRHPTDLAGLRGARMVTAVETEEGRRWAEAKIKTLTGGDKISARFMRQDFFEYVPQFKLLIAGNHKPSLRTVDEAIRRRFHLIPFTVTIPPEQRDATLGDRLKDEWPGILAWAIEGCLRWQAIGLAPPRAVQEATSKYLEAEDSINAWIDETCRRDPNAFTASARLFSSWTVWASLSGEAVGTQKSFVHSLESRGFEQQRRRLGDRYSNPVRGFSGLRVAL
jgi:putative DNA primase/helicase